MKINWANRLLIFVSFCIIAFGVFNIVSWRGWDRYYYATTAIAPQSYPVSIIECNFTTGDSDDDVFVLHEGVDNQNTKWSDEGDFLQLREKRRLPEKLNISYFSYRDKKFYKGTFQLPTKRIVQIFQQAIRNKNTEKYSSYRDQLRGLTFTVGIANNGQVLVWMRGIYLEQLILQVQLKATEPLSNEIRYDYLNPKNIDYDLIFEKLSDSLKLLIKQGYDSPANYADTATRYIENNTELWEYQRKNGYIDYGK